ncbi:hypothetical protein GCM10010172_54940 [Paractinoplanes ferrugineus]|uniref:Uncharacterized protein n=1 Tax=Paractinoplanes ferrugineus TaxID=113564 RepID=A0A919MEH5_9ACTN|nr:hypothetical protein [Actinoplanes ferrugineus]GIE11689.1 hypothetical protein Afe05nite_35290 [Actinoplanes ferrugineus]
MTVPNFSVPDSPAARPRPTVVTAASYLLYLVAVLEVISAIIAFSIIGTVSDALKDVYAGTALSDSSETIIKASYSVGAVLALLLAAGFAILGYFDGRGKNGARITTWVIGGIALCCFGAGLGGNAVSSSLGGSSGTTGGPTSDEVQRRVEDALPSWYTPVSTAVSVISLLALLAVIILLALPKSNEFFRKQPATGWDPQAGYPPYPGQPPYPQTGQPSYPQPGQAPYPQPGQGQYPQPGQPPYPPSGQPPYSPPSGGQPPYPGQQPPPGGLPPYPGQQPPEQPPNPPTNPS